MGIQRVGTARLMCEIHGVEVYRLKKGADHIVLLTNLPNPCWPYKGTLSLRTEVTRGSAEEWAKTNFPGCEVHVYDQTLPRADVPPQASHMVAGG